MEGLNEVHIAGSSRRNGIRKNERGDKGDLLAESIRFWHQLDGTGQYLSASPVHPAATAAVTHPRDGRPLVTDGSFIDTREQMAGYF